MRIALVGGTVALLAFVGGEAHANPITIGAFAGSAQSSKDADNGYDAEPTVGVFARIGFGRSFGLQFELQRYFLDDASRIGGTALGVIDLAHWKLDEGGRSTLAPIALVGVGFDSVSDHYGSDPTGQHVEAGLGLEYRWAGGLVLGVDARIGTMNVDVVDYAEPVAGGALERTTSSLSDGEYRSVRLTLGSRF